ncbi:hypothetical protein JCM6882_009732 [Rhodosporidiobolus microsporus]
MGTPSRLARLRNAVWPEPADPAERRLLRKVDALILSFLCLQYCVNYLDRVNYLNAYVSGMREALDMKGRDYNNVITCFTVGFALANIPQNLLLLVVPPRLLFSINGIIWGILTCLTACAKNVTHLYVIKFFQGMAEASTFVGAHYILGSWYLPSELGRRAGIFACSAHAATLFSGSMMASIYTNLDGKAGVAGWQWMFIICGVVTIPVALYGFFAFPDVPATTTTRFLTPDERALAITRLPPKSGGGRTRMDWSLWKRVLGRWHLWALSLVWIAGGALESYGAWGIMALWMKAQRSPSLLNPATGLPAAQYTIRQLNYHPLGIAGVAIAALLVAAVLTDRHPSKRYLVNLVIACCALVYGVIPLIGSLKYDGKAGGSLPAGAWYFAFYLSGISFAGQMSNFAWCNEIVADDEQERAAVLAGMNVISYAFNTWFQPVFWPASSAPHFTQGFSLIVAFVPILVLATGLTRFLQVREQRQRRVRNEGAMPEREKADEEEEGDESAGESVVSKDVSSRPTTATSSVTTGAAASLGSVSATRGLVNVLEK